MKIAVYGMGYVGFTAACCLAKEGHRVVGVEVNADKVREINDGIPPILEPEVADLLTQAQRNGLFDACTSLDDLTGFDLAIVCVGTPSNTDGSHNMGYIAEVTRQIARGVSPDRAQPLTVAFRSTFRPGTMKILVEPIFRNCLTDAGLKNIELVYNPEFLREVTAVQDYFNPPKIVIGTETGARSDIMDELHKNLDAPVFYTTFAEAEITKFVDNTWHALKVTYANEIGRICHKMNISVKTIHKIFVSDTKLNISEYYTRPGGAFGGSCLPKDVRALQYISQDIGLNTQLINSLLPSNEAHKTYQTEGIIRALPAGGRVLLVGLAFKAKTDDLRESPNVDIARKLLEGGYQLSIFDPAVKPDKLRGQNLGYAYTHLPMVRNILIDQTEAERGPWDLVVATNTLIDQIDVSAFPVVRTYQYA
ncbi:MAG: nucleotide sugar dehydrogenase [Rhodobacteraceae bacterium]|nr:nucleotide sugar dehydrogenase [Paracoccaceae bacterium]